MPSLLDLLRQTTQVDCDTLDAEVAQTLGPFADCTSNQLCKPLHRTLVQQAAADASRLRHLQPPASPGEFIVDILMVKLQLLVVPHLSGYVHVQTNPRLAYSTQGTLANARRIVALFQALSDVGPGRVCVKIPATWEGLQACRVLQKEGIATLATTMFCMEQAALAGHVGCTYIAPYVNELKVHFEDGYVDPSPSFPFTRLSQHYYAAHALRTQVLAASLTSTDQVMQLAGVHHITVAPPLLRQLAATDAASWTGSLGTYLAQPVSLDAEYDAILDDESAWRLAFARSAFGASEAKLVQAINYFCDFQEKMEALVAGVGSLHGQ
ncbi:uncharacterized protein UV8b_03298 [Ustilaginoidea virens]|uniref:Transaldolase n=1 Tax=Ustilaginoidea virens TaxID=1159556 RepID=A0A8E5MGZ4_USTVR|nr:uncharacterized protein UV8b_03298 [Ustilaginoidea virens]QUC19057.1 hypothetical protein UV8b_03298 [Ustilaginoidea virens]